KVTVVDEATGQFRKHLLFASDQKTVLAQAEISEHQSIDDPEGSDSEGAPAKVRLPRKLRLSWPPQRLTLDVTLSDVTLNPKFSAESRTAYFRLPEKSGYKLVDLAERYELENGGLDRAQKPGRQSARAE